LSPFAQQRPFFKGRFGALFILLGLFWSFGANASFDVDAFHRAYVQEFNDQIKEQLVVYFKRIGQPLPNSLSVDSNLLLDHLDGHSFVNQVNLSITLGTGLPEPLLLDARMYLGGWLKRNGYRLKTGETPSGKPIINIDLATAPNKIVNEGQQAILTLIAVLMVPFFTFFLLLGLRWQIRHKYRTIKPSKFETILQQSEPNQALKGQSKDLSPPQSIKEQLPTPPSEIMQPKDMQTMFDSMSFNQALDFLQPFAQDERLKVMDRLGLRGPVKQLVLDELKKRR
jgi:hypothetical protein